MKKVLLFLSISLSFIAKAQEVNSSMIVGGRDALDEEFKWMVELISDNEHMCGGVLIDPYWVLTAGHCALGDTVDGPFPPDRVIINNTQLATAQSFSEEYFVDTIIAYPGFDISTTQDSVFAKDIGLIRLKNPASFTPISLNTIDSNIVDLQDTVMTIGWGIATDTGEYLPFLRYAEPLVKKIESKKMYAGFDIGETPAGSGAGDSGGPLFIENGGDYVLLGVVSGNDDNNPVVTPGSHGRYTRVYGYKEWIQETIQSFEPVGQPEFEKTENISVSTVGENILIEQKEMELDHIHINVVNTLGQIVEIRQIKITGNSHIEDFSNLNRGIYFLKSQEGSINHVFTK